MKKWLIVCQLLMLSFFSNAQYKPKESYKLAVNTIFFGSGDLRGLNLIAEYNKGLNSHFTLSPSLQIGYGKNKFASQKSVAGNLNIFVSPMKFENSKLRIGAGPSVRLITGDIGKYTKNGELKSGGHLAIGLNIAAEGEFVIKDNFLIGIGGGMQPYTDGNIVSYFGVNFGYQF